MVSLLCYWLVARACRRGSLNAVPLGFGREGPFSLFAEVDREGGSERVTRLG